MSLSELLFWLFVDLSHEDWEEGGSIWEETSGQGSSGRPKGIQDTS